MHNLVGILVLAHPHCTTDISANQGHLTGDATRQGDTVNLGTTGMLQFAISQVQAGQYTLAVTWYAAGCKIILGVNNKAVANLDFSQSSSATISLNAGNDTIELDVDGTANACAIGSIQLTRQS